MGKNSKKKRRSRKNYVKAVKEAVTWLMVYRKRLIEKDDLELAGVVEQAYRDLWCECLPDPVPWGPPWKP